MNSWLQTSCLTAAHWGPLGHLTGLPGLDPPLNLLLRGLLVLRATPLVPAQRRAVCGTWTTCGPFPLLPHLVGKPDSLLPYQLHIHSWAVVYGLPSAMIWSLVLGGLAASMPALLLGSAPLLSVHAPPRLRPIMRPSCDQWYSGCLRRLAAATPLGFERLAGVKGVMPYEG